MKVSAAVLWCLLALRALAWAAFIDIREFGAVADDGEDDAPAIEAAMAAAGAGDTVWLPAGTWMISRAIRPKSSVRVRGPERERTIVKFCGKTKEAMFDLEKVSDVVLSDFTIDAGKNKLVQQGVQASNSRGIRLRDLGIKNLGETSSFGPHGIYLSENVIGATITNCVIESIGPGTKWGAGIRINNKSNGTEIVGNRIDGTGRGGILCAGSTGLIIRENRVTGSGGEGLGVEVWGGCDGALIEDNVIDHWLSVDESSGSSVRRNTVSAKDGTKKWAGLELVGSSDCIFTDNVVDSGAFIGISISNDDPKQYVLWGRNRILNCAMWGVQIQGGAAGAKRMYFYDNEIAGTVKDHPQAKYPGGHGFRINDHASNITLEANRIRDNGRDGIQLMGTDVDGLSFLGNEIVNNGGDAITEARGADFEWEHNTVARNLDNSEPASRGFANRKPVAAFECPAVVRFGDPVPLTNTSTDPDGKIAHVLWDFDEGLPVTEASPVFIFNKLGRRRVTLVVWDEQGRGARVEKIVEVRPKDF